MGEDYVIKEKTGRTVKTLPGTRQFHCVRSYSDGSVQARHLNCKCDACIKGTGQCSSQEVGDWTTFYLGKKKKKEKKKSQHANKFSFVLNRLYMQSIKIVY